MLRIATQTVFTALYLFIAFVFGNAVVGMWFQYEMKNRTIFDYLTGGMFTDLLVYVVILVYAFINVTALILSFVVVDRLFERKSPVERLKRESHS